MTKRGPLARQDLDGGDDEARSARRRDDDVGLRQAGREIAESGRFGVVALGELASLLGVRLATQPMNAPRSGSKPPARWPRKAPIQKNATVIGVPEGLLSRAAAAGEETDEGLLGNRRLGAHLLPACRAWRKRRSSTVH